MRSSLCSGHVVITYAYFKFVPTFIILFKIKTEHKHLVCHSPTKGKCIYGARESSLIHYFNYAGNYLVRPNFRKTKVGLEIIKVMIGGIAKCSPLSNDFTPTLSHLYSPYSLVYCIRISQHSKLWMGL